MRIVRNLISIALIGFIGFLNAQDVKNWRSMKPEQRQELINKMSSEEKINLLKTFRQRMMIDELEVPEAKQEEFKTLYDEYQESQTKIKGKFQPNPNYNTMTDQEAKAELEKSFIVGQELLNNRKKYAEKFQKVVKPQQVLEMFQSEGKMRNRVIDRKSDNQQRRPTKTGEMRNSGETRRINTESSGIRNPRNNNGANSQSRRP